MRYTLWMNDTYVCEAPTEDRAIADARLFASMWDKRVLVRDELRGKPAHVVKPAGAADANLNK